MQFGVIGTLPSAIFYVRHQSKDIILEIRTEPYKRLYAAVKYKMDCHCNLFLLFDQSGFSDKKLSV